MKMFIKALIAILITAFLICAVACLHKSLMPSAEVTSAPKYTIIYDDITDDITDDVSTEECTVSFTQEQENGTDTTDNVFESEEIEHVVEAVAYEDRYLVALFAFSEDTEKLSDTEPTNISEEFKYFTEYTWQGKTRKLPFSEKMQRYTYDVCQKYGVPYRTILGILGAETHWNEDASHVEVHSGTRYIGIGCLTEKYHADRFADIGINIYTLKGNIEALCIIFRGHMDMFDNDPTLAAMAYNGGHRYAQNRIADGIYSSGYTDKVNAYAESFR